MIFSFLYLRLRFLGTWITQWLPLSIVLVLEYLGLLLIAHNWVQLIAVPLFLWMLELVAVLGLWLQVLQAFAIQAAGSSRSQRILYRLSGLMIPLGLVLWLMVYTIIPKR